MHKQQLGNNLLGFPYPFCLLPMKNIVWLLDKRES